MFRDVYIRKDAELTAVEKARAAWLSTGATLAGLSAVAVFGTKWLDDDAPAEIVRGNRAQSAGHRHSQLSVGDGRDAVVPGSAPHDPGANSL
ncbi:hypothetical protein MBOU_03200 [Mycobacterium bourgelatii]|uniref:Uncharacterized protein n=1 Tax=Mycobacterium bourgelatii TaxID=1273442 RepID=A0A7I9YHY1_MYCBU|nr:hypothetical protein MBOU_03200 [Mycobacterium bourgelatii]